MSAWVRDATRSRYSMPFQVALGWHGVTVKRCTWRHRVPPWHVISLYLTHKALIMHCPQCRSSPQPGLTVDCMSSVLIHVKQSCSVVASKLLDKTYKSEFKKSTENQFFTITDCGTTIQNRVQEEAELAQWVWFYLVQMFWLPFSFKCLLWNSYLGRVSDTQTLAACYLKCFQENWGFKLRNKLSLPWQWKRIPDELIFVSVDVFNTRTFLTDR